MIEREWKVMFVSFTTGTYNKFQSISVNIIFCLKIYDPADRTYLQASIGPLLTSAFARDFF